jgi:N4-gp56 family major capsid protein
MHINREMIMGANEITEDALQIDLLTSAGVIRYAGNATSKATIDVTDVVDYSDLMHLAIDLDNKLSGDDPESSAIGNLAQALAGLASGPLVEDRM